MSVSSNIHVLPPNLHLLLPSINWHNHLALSFVCHNDLDACSDICEINSGCVGRSPK